MPPLSVGMTRGATRARPVAVSPIRRAEVRIEEVSEPRPGQIVAVVRQDVHLALAGRAGELARPEVAVDAVARDALGDQALGLLRHREPGLRGVAPERRFDGTETGGVAGADLAAVASRRAPGDGALVEHRDAVAAGAQLQRRRQPGEARPHHRHVGLDGAFERGEGRVGGCRRLVVAGGVENAL